MKNTISAIIKAAFLSSGLGVLGASPALAQHLKCGNNYVYHNDHAEKEVKSMSVGHNSLNAFSFIPLSPSELRQRKTVVVESTSAVNVWAPPYNYRGLVREFYISGRKEYPTKGLLPITPDGQMMDSFRLAGFGDCRPG